jgi:hypothetical protein
MHPSRWTARVGAIALLGSLGFVSSAQAAVFSPPTVNVPVQLTNYTKSVSVAKFDPSLGVLQSILLTFNGKVTGEISVDNNSASDAVVDLNLASELKLSQSDLGTLFTIITLNPSDSRKVNLTADDGDRVNGAVSLYTGTDSKVTTDLQGLQSGTKLYTAATDAAKLASFTGTGNVDFQIGARARSSANSDDSGNLGSLFKTNAGADFTITYTYAAPVRVPEASANIGVGLLAAGVMMTQLKRISRFA